MEWRLNPEAIWVKNPDGGTGSTKTGIGGSGEGILGGLERPSGAGREKEVGVANSLGPPRCLCSWTSSIRVTWVHVRNAESHAPPQPACVRVCILFNRNSRCFSCTLQFEKC